MVIDKDRIAFKSMAIEIAEKFGASVGKAEAQPYLDRMYEEWKGIGKPVAEISEWLTVRFRSAFVSLREPPAWVEEEPAWAFHGAEPMVFISQASLGSPKPGVPPLSPGETVYLFGVREPASKGFSLAYKTVSQFEE